jgi:hypothetical protein
VFHTPIWIEGATNANRGKRKKEREKKRGFGKIQHVLSPSDVASVCRDNEILPLTDEIRRLRSKSLNEVAPAQPNVPFFQSLNVVSVLKRKSDVTHYLDEDK